MSFNVILIFPIWVSLFVSSPKMSKCDGKMEIFCWLALTLHFPSHLCVQSTELHGNGASTKSVPCSKVWLCPHTAFHTSLGLHNSPIFTLQATGREGRSVKAPQDEESGSTNRDPAAISLQNFTQQQSWVKSTGFSDWASDPALLLKWHSLDRARPRDQGLEGHGFSSQLQFLLGLGIVFIPLAFYQV